MRAALTILLALSGSIAVRSVALADCNELAQSVQALESQGDVRNQSLIASLHWLHYRNCVVDPVQPRQETRWYDTEGRDVGGTEGGRPPGAAFATTPDVAQRCRGSGNPSICALVADAQAAENRRRDAPAVDQSRAIGRPYDGVSSRCRLFLGLLVKNAKSGDQSAVGDYTKLKNGCGDLLDTVAKEAGATLPRRRMGELSRGYFSRAIQRAENPTLSDSEADARDYDVADVLAFGLQIAGLAAQINAVSSHASRATAVRTVGARLPNPQCQQLRDLANTCAQRRDSMANIGAGGGGAVGQAGAFNDCARIYRSAISAACR